MQEQALWSKRWLFGGLMAGMSVLVLTFAAPAVAQTTAASAASSSDNALEEIVVTATRRAETLSKVPVSIAATTQAEMDVKGIQSIDDLARSTPGLTLRRNAFGTQANISIRGISSTIGNGTGTVGVYVDDTPIQIRRIGYTSTNVYPRLFDLERVEVLRGPQGTLFGAGSLGGTVRFITRPPTLSETAGYIRTEVGSIDGGAQNYEIRAAAGGPINDDTLGYRASINYRYGGGWIDRVDNANGAINEKNSNYEKSTVARLALTWAPNDRVTITPSILFQDVGMNDLYTYWDALSNPGDNEYRNGQRLRQPDDSRLVLPAIKAEYFGDRFDIISNTSYFESTHSATDDYTNLMVGIYANANTLPELPDYEAAAIVNNNYESFTQEVRIQSNSQDSRLDWVVGVFYNKLTEYADELILDPQMGDLFRVVYDDPTLTVADVTGLDLIDGLYSFEARFDTEDEQIAVYGETTYELTDGLRAIFGVRYGRSRFSAANFVTGPFNYGTVMDGGKGEESPFTPKIGLSWQVNDNNLVYATIAEGFRIGGVNPDIPPGACSAELDTRGYSDGAPSSYESDSLLSYEVGVKSNLFDGATRVAASIFHIKWEDIQRNVYLGSCGLQFTDNLGAAASNGFDLSLTQWLSPNFVANIHAGYTDAHFTTDIYGRPDRLPQVREGNSLMSQPWIVAVGAEYQRTFGSRDTYARVDYNYIGGDEMTAGSDPTTSSYNPNNFDPEATRNVNVRLGVAMGSMDLALFVTNLFNDHPALSHYAEGGDPIFRETTITPRTIGVTATFNYY